MRKPFSSAGRSWPWTSFRFAMAALVIAALAGGAVVAVLTRSSGGCATPPRPVTVGPAVARGAAGKSALPCTVTYAGGYLYYTLTDRRIMDSDPGLVGSLVRRISLHSGHITTLAGVPARGQAGQGASAAAAFIGPSCGLAVDRAGNVLVSDSALVQYKEGDAGRSQVRAIAAVTGSIYGQQAQSGHVYTVVGCGSDGYAGDGGAAGAAQVSFPGGLAIDPAGDLIIADTANNVIRLVAARSGSWYGVQMVAGDIYTIAGMRGYGGHGPSYGNGVPARTAVLNLWNDLSNNGPVPFGHAGIAADGNGNIVISDPGSAEVRVVAASDGNFYGKQMRAGYIYTIVGGGVDQPAPDGDLALHARYFSMGPVALDNSGNLLFGTGQGMAVLPVRSRVYYGRHVQAGHIYYLTGPGSGKGSRALVPQPLGIAVDDQGNIAFTAITGAPYRTQYRFALEVIAARSGRYYGIAMQAGHIYPIPSAIAWP